VQTGEPTRIVSYQDPDLVVIKRDLARKYKQAVEEYRQLYPTPEKTPQKKPAKETPVLPASYKIPKLKKSGPTTSTSSQLKKPPPFPKSVPQAAPRPKKIKLTFSPDHHGDLDDRIDRLSKSDSDWKLQ
jgi:hypothetical protein